MSENKALNIQQEEDRHIFHTDRYGCLLSYEGDGKEVTVPADVKSIGDEAFAYCDHVTSVILPEGLQYIGKKAFFKSGIRTVSLPHSLKKIDECAFADTPLESIEIPDHVTEIREQAFSGAEQLRNVRLPEGLKSLDPGLFAGCISLQEIVLPSSLKHIEAGAFRDCTGLRRISLPEGLVSIWHQAFDGCSLLEKIYLGASVEAIGRYAFRNCRKLKKVRIPRRLKSFGFEAFDGDHDLILEGPGQINGLIISDDEIRYCSPGLKKVIIPKGIEEIEESVLDTLKAPEVFDLPKSLQYYSWTSFAQFGSLKKIITDRNALAAEIAYMLDLACTDRIGRPFTYKAPEGNGEWITESDGEQIIIKGCRGRAGHTGSAEYTTVVIPAEISGLPVTGIGAEAFMDNDTSDAFYIPDTVKFIGSRAFARMGYCRYGYKLFVRMPEGICIASDAFEETQYFTKKDACRKEAAGEPAQPAPGKSIDTEYAEAAADDPLIGTGTNGHDLKANIWQYFDRLSRKERIRELTHSFSVSGSIDGVGWASVEIEADNESARFRISYIGASPADFRRFVYDIDDGEIKRFAWASEPGAYPWIIQRRGSILYVSAPEIRKTFFIPREQFLLAVKDMKDEWKY